MSGDIQPRKRRGKAKKKDEAEDEIVDTKSKPMVNNNHHKSNGTSSGGSSSRSDGSGIVAKMIFMILLVSLAAVIGLILIELRGKQVGMDTPSVVPKAEEPVAPEIPTPSLHVDEEPVPEPPAPNIDGEIEEDYEPLEATPPLEEYIKVVEKEEEAPVENTEEVVEEQVVEEPVVEVVEVVEEIPVEIVEEIVTVEVEPSEGEVVEELKESAPLEEIEEPVIEEVVEEAAPLEVEEPVPAEEEAVPVEDVMPVEEVEEAAPVEEVEEAAPVEEIEEAAPVEEVEEAAPVEEEDEDAAPVEEVEEAAPVEEVEESAPVEEVEQVAPVEDIEETAPVEEVEEVAPIEVVEETTPLEVEEVEEAGEEAEEALPVEEAAPVEEVVETEEAPVQVEEPVPVVEEIIAAKAVEEVEAPVEKEEEMKDEESDDIEGADDEDKDEEQAAASAEEEEEEDEDILEKEGTTSLLTDAYLKVEALADEVLRVDPENDMVKQLTPHLSGVLRAMEEGRTEGLLDTLNHIQVILEDIKTRVEQPQESSETISEPNAEEVQPAIESVEAEAEPVVEAEAEPVVEAEAEPVVEAEAEPIVEAEAEPIVEAEAEPIVEAEAEPVVEAEVEIEPVAEAEADPAETEAEAEPVVAEDLVGQDSSPADEPERVFPLDDAAVAEEVIANIEEQIVSHEEMAAAEEEDIPIPSIVETNTVFPPEESNEGEEPVPVDEVIPEPVYIKPLQEDSAPAESSQEVYEKADITSKIDNEIREDLDAAENLMSENLRDALNSFGALLQTHPNSARAIYGRAMCLDRLAEVERSNSKLEQAIVTYRGVLDLSDEDPELVPLPLLRIAAEKCIDRMRFRGFSGKAVRVQQRLLRKFPDDLNLRNQMGVTFLLMNQPSAAKEVFEEVLEKWPEDGFAQVHYGFILKTSDNNNTVGAEFLRKGINSEAEGTQDGRFFFHLGDALQREGKTEQAYKVYDEGVEKGLFLNRYQRSLYNVDRLSSQPVWSLEQTPYTEFFRKLEANWEVIRDEGAALLSEPPQDGYRPEAENLQDTGDWKQYALFTRGRKITANCVKAKVTCSLIEDFPPAAGCKRGQVKFSVMQPNTHVHAHTGPTNCRLRAHLGLIVPSGVQMRIAEERLMWEEGKILIFDDSWEHEVWHNGSSDRLVLIVDVWHPDLTDHEKKTLSPI